MRKFHRHSSQNGAPPSRGVRHCGQSSASEFGRAGGGYGFPPPARPNSAAELCPQCRTPREG
ncbi:hypothetical protein JHN47_51800, partial [Streptomyces sp. MBT62]|nr:hypothetical protein [Streptomyces sp. MBT62]